MEKRDGFTLVEVIVTAVILVLIASIAIPAMTGYLDRSAQTARNNNARTLFLAAQTALTNEYGRGQKLNTDGATLVSLGAIRPAITDQEQADNSKNIYAVYLNAGGSGYLKELLDPYINDKELLTKAILIECNLLTGRVLSCFYSDVVPSFGYGGGGYDVRNRSKEALTAARVGYYGVEYTGKLPENTPIGDIVVRLRDYTNPAGTLDGINGGKNYGLLTLELTLPETLREDIDYTVELRSGGTPFDGSQNAVAKLTISGGASLDKNIQLSKALVNTTLSAALQFPLTYPDEANAEHKVYAYTETRAVLGKTEPEQILVIVLDAPEEALSIAKNYPTLGSGLLNATVTASDGTETVTATSAESGGESVQTLFAAEGFGTETEPNTLTSIRHLNNIRYAPDQNVQQAADIACLNYDGAIKSFSPLCTELEGASGFTGKLDGNGFSIVDLRVSGVQNAGLFDTVGAKGRVEHINLSYQQMTSGTTISGTERAGGIAAVNLGTISACTVTGSIQSDGAGGGIAGENLAGAGIVYCMGAAHVTAMTSAGGIAGESAGGIAFSETGTAADSDDSWGHISGRPYFGAGYPEADYAYKFAETYGVENDVFTVAATGTTGKGAAAGGIVGRITGKNGRVTASVNAAKVHAYGGVAGGIAGIVDFGDAEKTDVVLTRCYNAGAVMGGSNASAGGAAGGIAGELVGAMKACYNTGRVNAEYTFEQKGYVFDTSTSNMHYKTDSTEPIHYIGGVLGHGLAGSFVTDCYNAAIAGDAFGGAFGLMEGTAEKVRFLRNLHNTEEDYYFRTNQDKPEDNRHDDGVQRISSETLRGTWFTGGTFTRGAIKGVGPYQYTLPYYQAQETGNYVCTLGDDFHRTPYVKPLEAMGDIRLENLSDGRILVHFFTLDSSVDLKLVTNAGEDTANTDTISLSKDMLKYMSGASEKRPRLITTYNDGEVHSFWAYSLPASEEKQYMGYDREYCLLLRWDDDGDNALNDHLHPGAATLKGYLYKTGETEKEFRYAESNVIARGDGEEAVYMVDDEGNAASVIHVSKAEQGKYPVDKVTIVYPFLNGPDNYQVIADNIGNNDVVGSFEKIFDKKKPPRFHVSGGANLGSGNYALYQHDGGSGPIRILLSTSSPLDQNGYFTRDNALLTTNDTDHVMEPFYILVEVNGKEYSSTLYKEWKLQ